MRERKREREESNYTCMHNLYIDSIHQWSILSLSHDNIIQFTYLLIEPHNV